MVNSFMGLSSDVDSTSYSEPDESDIDFLEYSSVLSKENNPPTFTKLRP